MNHNRLSISKIIYSVLIFVFTVLFFSCENFLDSGDVKEAIDKAIYIANSECPVATVEEPIFQNEGVEKNKAICSSIISSYIVGLTEKDCAELVDRSETIYASIT